jgi:predicted nucleic acid-binding protein
MEGVVIDTNVFVAAGFNPGSASARVIAGIREGRFRLIWNGPTRRETEMILRRIPRLDWERIADLFRPDGEFTGPVDPEAFAAIEDPDDRKFAALSAAARAPLVTSDKPVLAQSGAVGIEALSPTAFLARENRRPMLGSSREHSEARRRD